MCLTGLKKWGEYIIQLCLLASILLDELRDFGVNGSVSVHSPDGIDVRVCWLVVHYDGFGVCAFNKLELSKNDSN